MSKKLFSIEEIRNYIESKDSLGDVAHFLSEENIIKANEKVKDNDDDCDCCNLDCDKCCK